MSELSTEERYLQFLQTVRVMRDAQKAYFKYRKSIDLEASKMYEKRVDQLLDESVHGTQAKMF